MTFEFAFDALLGVTLIWLCWRVLGSQDLFRAVVLFIIFGLLMALAWARLDAPDIAMAEAAIGAGLTGALMLDAVGQMTGLDNNFHRRERAGEEAEVDES